MDLQQLLAYGNDAAAAAALRVCIAAALYVKGPRELGVVHLTNEEQTLFAKKCAYAADVFLFALRETKPA